MSKVKSILKIVLAIAILIPTCCNRNHPEILYKKLEIRDRITKYTSREVPFIYDLAKIGQNLFIISKKHIWLIDLKLKTERVLINEGIGPGEIYSPLRIVAFTGDLYINSNLPLKYVYHISTRVDGFKLDRLNFGSLLTFDDFDFIPGNEMVMANVYWESGFIRFYDFNTKKILERGKSKITDIMLKFNVNSAYICALGDKIYAAQATKPEIITISKKEKKILDVIKLSPPFYKFIPGEYNVANYDEKNHKKWMASWTSIIDLLGKNDWLLVVYRWGYEQRYCYELINTNHPDHRFFIDETPFMIYSFEVHKGWVDFEFYEDDGEKISWQEGKSFIVY
jgi:hypothetical protein